MYQYANPPGTGRAEVWFWVAHIAQDGHNGDPLAAYREQTVEIALGVHST